MGGRVEDPVAPGRDVLGSIENLTAHGLCSENAGSTGSEQRAAVAPASPPVKAQPERAFIAEDGDATTTALLRVFIPGCEPRLMGSVLKMQVWIGSSEMRRSLFGVRKLASAFAGSGSC